MSFLKKALLASFALMQGAYTLLDSGVFVELGRLLGYVKHSNLPDLGWY